MATPIKMTIAQTVRLRLAALALALGGVLGAGFGVVYYVYTHGSTQHARADTLFALDGAAWCRLEVAQPGLLLAGLALAFGPAVGRLGWQRRVGLLVACGALAAQVLALVLQCWVAHPDRDFPSLRVVLGFVLGVLANLPLAIGLIVLGRAAGRPWLPVRAPWLPRLVGYLVLPTVVIAAVLQDGVSTGGPAWDWGLAAVRVPLALAWVLLGAAMWRETTVQPPRSEDRRPAPRLPERRVRPGRAASNSGADLRP